MKSRLQKLAHRPLLPNFIFRKPEAGALVFGLFCFVFMLLYKPLNSHPSGQLSYSTSMALYTLAGTMGTWLFSRMLRQAPILRDTSGWTLSKEVLAGTIMLSAAGIAVFAIGFVLEPPKPRWNVTTLLNSIGTTMLVGAIPFALFSMLGTRRHHKTRAEENKNEEQQISIKSHLKKERLSLAPSQLLYAESDGNYVSFFLLEDGKVRRHYVRSTISDIEKQLKEFPYIIRTHRAFIVNLRHITSSQGNSAGYKLRLGNLNTEVPVARQRTEAFEVALRNMNA